MIGKRMKRQPSKADRCAFYGRVSNKNQKLKQQWTLAENYCKFHEIVISEGDRYSDKEKRHKSENREEFQRLLMACEQGKYDWIIISAFDRWGVKGTDELFAFRSRLKEYGVKLWSVSDQLELTGVDDDDYMRIIMTALAATKQMQFYADRNIMKMVEMAKHGWHASGSVPYGMDLRCSPLNDKDKTLFRLHTIARPRDGQASYKIISPDGSEKLVSRMPARKSKETGYRLTPSIDGNRIKAIRVIFELYSRDYHPAEIRRQLHERGLSHYGKPFQDNAINTIVANPAYIGRPAWGKYAIGFYRQVFDQFPIAPPERKKGEAKQYFKDSAHFVSSLEPIFEEDTFVSKEVWELVQTRLESKRRNKKSRPRTRNRSNHPLNGIIECPSCGEKMVTGSGTSRSGEKQNYFICGSYAKSKRIACRANSVNWNLLDSSLEELVTVVADNVSSIAKLNPTKPLVDLSAIDPALGFVLQFVNKIRHELGVKPVKSLKKQKIDSLLKRYRRLKCKSKKRSLVQKETAIREIKNLGQLIRETPSSTLRSQWNEELRDLEAKLSRLDDSHSDLEVQLLSAIDNAKGIVESIKSQKSVERARVFEFLLSGVKPIMRLENMKNGKTRTKVIGFEFVGNKGVSEHVPSALQLGGSHRGKD